MVNHHDDEYDDELIALLQLVWGPGFMAPGGPASVQRTVEGVDVTGQSVLDIGCGLGGADFVLADMGAVVTGLDVEAGLIDRARQATESSKVTFVLAEPGSLPFEGGAFDHVFSHAAIIHVPDKRALFADVFRVLRPGGWLLAYDWLRGTEPYSTDMHRWFELEGLTYEMDHLANYLSILAETGYVDVSGTDDAETYRDIAHTEYQRMLGEWFLPMTELLGPDRRDHFIEDWRMLTVVLDNGELRPAYFRARKPS